MAGLSCIPHAFHLCHITHGKKILTDHDGLLVSIRSPTTGLPSAERRDRNAQPVHSLAGTPAVQLIGTMRFCIHFLPHPASPDFTFWLFFGISWAYTPLSPTPLPRPTRFPAPFPRTCPSSCRPFPPSLPAAPLSSCPPSSSLFPLPSLRPCLLTPAVVYPHTHTLSRLSRGLLPPAVLALLWRLQGNLEEVYLLSSSHDLWASAADMHQRYRRVSRAPCPSAAEAGGVALKLGARPVEFASRCMPEKGSGYCKRDIDAAIIMSG